jgi:ubiquinone/menaquinone biosynthesis C-methylase UbiE
MDKQTRQQLLDVVKKNYEEIAEEYDRTRRKKTTLLWRKVADYAEQVNPGSKVLDVGCGNGKLLEFLPQGVDYLGVDFSNRVIGIAKARFREERFEVADILNLEKIKGSGFDHVFCIAVFHHLPSRQLRVQALQEMTRKMSQDGQLVLTAWNLWGQKKFRKLIVKNILLKILGKNKMDIGDIVFDWKGNNKQTVSRRYYHGFTKRELKKAVKQAGLSLVQLRKDNYNYFVIVKKRSKG